MSKHILGIWDGHDSGAALIEGNSVIAAINEERLSRRKLEVRFPEKSIQACLDAACLNPRDIDTIAISTSDFAKTIARILPYTKEEYYLIRRRKKTPGRFTALKKMAKYKITEIGYNDATRYISKRCLQTSLNKLGFTNYRIELIDHHLCHAATAAFYSGYDTCLVMTLDGIGDGLSGTISTCIHGTLTRIASLAGCHSLGIFFEHVTNLMNMRELEDEGKVMAIANYAYPVPDDENPMLDFVKVEGMELRCMYSTLRMYDELKKILWKYPSEQFAYMAQKTLEVKICELVRNCVSATGQKKVALAGGIFSNIKLNMHLSLLPEIQDCFIFPHMGDGGLALGAASMLNYKRNGITSYPLQNVYWGPEYSDDEILADVQGSGVTYRYCEHIEEEAAKLIAAGHIVFWFQGRMEYGPRALGNRSILALPNSARIKDILNLRLKMRVWYQPFCPSMLHEEAFEHLDHFNGAPNHFMTMGYMVKEDKRRNMEGVIGIDGSCRPQMVTSNEPRYEKLLQAIKKLTGTGILLNTSFNVHGDPLVCSPQDALATLKKTGNDYMIMGNYLLSA